MTLTLSVCPGSQEPSKPTSFLLVHPNPPPPPQLHMYILAGKSRTQLVSTDMYIHMYSAKNVLHTPKSLVRLFYSAPMVSTAKSAAAKKKKKKNTMKRLRVCPLQQSNQSESLEYCTAWVHNKGFALQRLSHNFKCITRWTTKRAKETKNH